MKKIISFGLLTLGCFIFLGAAQKIPLEQAAREALKISPELKIRYLEEQAASIKQQLASREKLFTLDFKANYLYRSQTMSAEIPSFEVPGLGSLSPFSIEAGLHHNYDLSLSLFQPLFTGGILKNREKLTEIEKAAAENETELANINIIGAVKSSYFTYLALVRKKESMLSLKKALEFHRQKLNNLFEEGLVRKTDVLETSAKIKEISLSLEDINQAIKEEEIRFNYLCGYFPEDIIQLNPEEHLRLEEARSYFELNHPVLLSLNNRINIIKTQKKILAGQYLPHLAVFAGLHYGKPGIDFFKKEWALYFEGGITLSLPVFDWGKKYGRENLLDYQLEKIENQKKNFIREGTQALKKLYSFLQSLKNKLLTLRQLKSMAEEEAELKQALYRQKQISHLDYLAALEASARYESLEKELRVQVEQVKVRINTLIGRYKEDL